MSPDGVVALALAAMISTVAHTQPAPTSNYTSFDAVPGKPGQLGYRTRVDIGVYPWSSVGKLYNSTGGACTGSLVGPNKVLTAAHCIFNTRTWRLLYRS